MGASLETLRRRGYDFNKFVVQMKHGYDGRNLGIIITKGDAWYVDMLTKNPHCIPASEISMDMIANMYDPYTVAEVIQSLGNPGSNMADNYAEFAKVISERHPARRIDEKNPGGWYIGVYGYGYWSADDIT